MRLLIALLLAGTLSACGEPRYRQVVLVTIDTLRADHLPAYGYPRPTAPFLDELAETGVVFTRAHATMSITAPSHASMFTGLLPAQHGLLRNGDTLPPELPALARTFRRAGYQTAAFTSAIFLQRVATGFRTIDSELREGEATMERALKWVERLEPDQPFLLWVHLFDVHEAGIPGKEAPPELYEEIEEGTALDRDALYSRLAMHHGLPDPPAGAPFPEMKWAIIENGRPLTRRSRAELLASIDHYDAQIARVDGLIRRLYEAVEGLGSETPRLWVITSDHGEGLGSHGYRSHDRLIYQEQLRVPLVFHATDGAIAPGRDDSLVSLVDLFPTLLDAAGEETATEANPEGISLWSRLIDGKPVERGRTVFAQRKPMPQAEGGVFAAITENHKYILHTGAEDEFFDLVGDPLELRSDPDHPDAKALLDRATSKLDETGWGALLSPTGDQIPAEVMNELRALGYVE
ncbi:MAG TPA: sulfatase [bacterium]|nr:sulfatase [bacterium]